MATEFKTIDDLKDPAKMKTALKRLRRQTKPSAFLFKARCEALGGEPVLVLARPGRQLSRELIKAIRPGTLSIKGQVHREGTDLIFSTETEVNKKRMIALLAKISERSKARIPRRRIQIRTPSDRATAPERTRALESTAPEVTSSPRPLDTSPRETSPEVTAPGSFPERREALSSLRSDLREWTDEAARLRDEELARTESVAAVRGSLARLGQQREALSEQTDREALIEAVEAIIGARLDSGDPGLRSLLRQLEKADDMAEAVEIAQDWVAEMEEDEVWELEAEEEDLQEARREHREQEERVVLARRSLRREEVNLRRDIRLQQESREEGCAQTLKARREAFLEAIKKLEAHSSDFSKGGLLLAEAEASFEQLGWIAKADRDRLRAARLQFEQTAAAHTSEEDREDIDEELKALEGYIAHLSMAVDHNSSRVSTLEGQIKAQRRRVIDMLEDLIDEFPHLADTLRLLRELDAAVEESESRLTELRERREKAEEEEATAELQEKLSEEIATVTEEYSADRAKRDTRDITLDHEPIQDLRLENPRLHQRLSVILDALPEMAGLLTELILRIRRLEDAGAGDLDILGEQYGPLTPMWEGMPHGPTPSQFRQQLAQWRRRETRLWRLLGQPLEVHR